MRLFFNGYGLHYKLRMKDKKVDTYQISLYISESPIHSSREFVNCSAIWRFT